MLCDRDEAVETLRASRLAFCIRTLAFEGATFDRIFVSQPQQNAALDPENPLDVLGVTPAGLTKSRAVILGLGFRRRLKMRGVSADDFPSDRLEMVGLGT